MYKFARVMTLGIFLMLVGSTAFAAEFVCLDVPEKKWTKEEQRNIDLFWNDTLAYLEAYVKALETPTGKCLDSAEAVVSSYNSETGKPEKECITKKRDVELLIKHVKAVLAEPEKAKRCFDPQLSNSNGWTKLYTPSRELQNYSPVSKWLNRPVAVDYFEKVKDPEIKKAGIELNKNFVAIASKTDSSDHFSRDVTLKGLPHLWSSVGWIPFYAESEKAWNKDIRGGYLYAEVMGPWGNLRIDTIDGETVGAEIGMTAQLNDSSYPVHFHHPQEIYMTLTTPEHPKQNQFLLMDWDSDQFEAVRTEDGFDVEVKGEGKWENWYMSADPKENWLIYLERNALHAFYAGDDKNADLENSGWVSVWARTTARDNNQTTQISVPADKNTKRILPDTHVHAHTKRWKP